MLTLALMTTALLACLPVHEIELLCHVAWSVLVDGLVSAALVLGAVVGTAVGGLVLLLAVVLIWRPPWV